MADDERRAGRSVPTSRGAPAFLPAPLPPPISWSPTLLRALSDADRALGRLAGEGGRLPNPHLLIRPFVRREAASRVGSRAQATLGELLAAEAGAAVARSPDDLREESRNDYYGRLRGVGERGEWEQWLEYFLVGVARQGEDAVVRAARIHDLLGEWWVKASMAGGRVAAAVVDLLGENPFFTATGLASRLGVAYTTSQRAIEKLEALGIAMRIGDAKRDRVYCARALLEALGEPLEAAR